ncbi:MAG: hypothetical protein HYU75_19510 [Betaproteobacteria bacterium]|nr:hypothetical protein [Betaproteobacteria bacterium]
MMKTTFIRTLSGVALALAFGAAAAQGYPNKPIKFVVGFAPGGANDTLARLVGQRLSDRVGQPVIVENKPGADSIIGTDYVAKAAPDGYTLLVSSVAMVLNPSLYDRVPYDAGKDFIPVTLFASDPVVFAVHPSVPAASIKELVALAKSKQLLASTSSTFPTRAAGRRSPPRFRAKSPSSRWKSPRRWRSCAPGNFAPWRSPAPGDPKSHPPFRPCQSPGCPISSRYCGSACSLPGQLRARSSSGSMARCPPSSSPAA